MAIAKNFAQSGVWGITPYEFTSCSSSILWTSILALIYLITGMNQYVPMILNLLAAFLVLYSSERILKKYEVGKSGIVVTLFLLVVVTPLPPLMFTGLEHVLHIWLSLLFIFYVSEGLSEAEKDSRTFTVILLLSALLPAIRYEGIFLVAVSVFLFILKGKWLKSLLILIFSLLPIFIFGVASISSGWSFFPNSLLLKGSFPDVTSPGDFFFFMWHVIGSILSLKLMVIAGILLVVIILMLMKFRKPVSGPFQTNISYMILLFSANIFLYAAYSRSGWSYRYQSFLVSIGIIVFGIVTFKYILPSLKKKFRLVVFIPFALIIVLCLYFSILGLNLLNKTPQASVNIYQQQYQMAAFLSKYYTNKGVALNDIGACNYFAEIKCLDLWGLGNLEISRQRRNGTFNAESIELAAQKQGIEIAIVYDSWFSEGDSSCIPQSWSAAGKWEIKNNVIAGDDNITFYAAKEEYFDELVANLKSYSANLPPEVIQSGYYIQK